MEQPIPFGPYVLLERINVGGMAEVFRARERGREGFERSVAVKKILPHIAADPELAEMFREEARVASTLIHGNIVQVFGHGKEGGSAYIAMEYVRGRDLRAVNQYCHRQQAPMPVTQACHIVLKVASALDYAHNKVDRDHGRLGLVHRDVSPGNILIAFDGDVKVIDFGVAWVAGRGHEPPREALQGKIGYAAPEQLQGARVDARADVFSLGVVLDELLTGQRLFSSEHREYPVPAPSSHRAEIPAALDALVLRALAQRPEDRFPTVGVFHDALQAFLYDSRSFYSRQDLASWMHRAFATMIDRDKRRERSLAVPPPPPAEAPRSPARLRQVWLPAASNAEVSASGGQKRRQTLVLTSNRRTVPSQRARRGAPPPQPSPSPAGAVSAAALATDDIEWSEEELETQAYTLGGFVEVGAPLPERPPLPQPPTWESPLESAAAPPGIEVADEGELPSANLTVPGTGRWASAGCIEHDSAQSDAGPVSIPAAGVKVAPGVAIAVTPEPSLELETRPSGRGGRWAVAALALLSAGAVYVWVARQDLLPGGAAAVSVSSVVSQQDAAASPPSSAAAPPPVVIASAPVPPDPDVEVHVAAEAADPASESESEEPSASATKRRHSLPAAKHRRKSSQAPRAQKRSDEPAAAEKSATLRIGTVSGVAPADVRVDGEYIGKTPKASIAVTPGRHTVTYTWPDGREIRKTVQVTEGAVKIVKAG